jgi:nitrogen fixation protein NifX
MISTQLKFAFASSDLKQVDQHFGSARTFVIYAVDQDQAGLLEVAQFEEQAQDGNENKLIDKFAVLDGCAAVYCQAVGGSAIRQLNALGIQPVKVSAGAEIAELIRAIQDELRAGPGAWLAQAIRRRQPRDQQRFDAMEAEGWEE